MSSLRDNWSIFVQDDLLGRSWCHKILDGWRYWHKNLGWRSW